MGIDPRPITGCNEESTQSDRRLTGAWRKATYSGASGACVEAAHLAPTLVGLRDSKHPDGTALELPTREWALFISSR